MTQQSQVKGMDSKDDKLQEFVRFQCSRKLTQITKTFLNLLEEIKINDKNFDFLKYRKKCLDTMNDSIREIDELFSKVNFTLK